MQSTLIEFINNYGYIGIMLLIFVENIFPPIPSEVVLVFGGFLTTQADMSIPLVILFATFGATLGAAVLYGLGRVLSRERIKKLVSGKFGKTIHMQPDDVTRAESWFKSYEYKAVLICRCIPVVRSLISIPAGMAKMKPLPFFALTVLGTAVWNTILVFIGALAGNAWETSLKYIGWYSTAAIVLLLLVGAVICYLYLKRRFLKKKQSEDQNDG
ncbi:MAG: DedA family protein [Oscillospiraceae bacterium]|nr:DedA family protein [Oscillospiraceae bacterium]